MASGADTRTHTHTHTHAYRHADQNNFKKPGVHGRRPRAPGLTMTVNDVKLHSYIRTKQKQPESVKRALPSKVESML